MSRVSYASAVGSIMYTMICTWLDVAYSLKIVSRYQSDLGENHWKVVKTILKYLKNIKDQRLIYDETDLKLVGFTDFNFQSDHDDSKSVSRYIFTLNSGAICWKNFKQHTVADSVCEVEYITTSDTVKKAVWLWKFIGELEVAPSIDGLVLLYCAALEPLLKPRSRSSISAPSIFYTTTTLFGSVGFRWCSRI